ncbi:MAG: GNAT family N-acetyltransferase [Maricaulaceae bacterium]|jgi:ribosomal-protein-alanine N-acetyltransferase
MQSTSPHQLLTERLLLRRWREDDLDPYFDMHADPEVARHLLPPPDRETAAAQIDMFEACFETHGVGFWALERRDEPGFIGFTGLFVPQIDAHFTPCVEVGWRLARPFWGRGYATEAARAAMADGFARRGLDEIVAMTSVMNARSQAVMQRLGMTRDPADDFAHPRVPDGDPLKPHVLYRITASQFAAALKPA